MDDMALLQEFALRQSQEAFRALVNRHIDFVFSVALRQVHDAQTAEEVAQSVFIDLAAKAAVLPQGTILSGWLFRAVRFAAAKALRSDIRRQRREREAMESTIQQTNTESPWQQMEPILNEALGELSEADRCALLLRFFEKKPLKEVAARLGLNEGAAKKRVARAIEKLRFIFQQRGVAIPSALLLTVLSQQTLPAAPAGLAASVANLAAIQGTALATTTLTLGKGVVKLMALSKLKIAATATAALLLVSGTTTYIIKQNQPLALLPQTQADDEGVLRIIDSLHSGVLEKAPPLVFLRVARPSPATREGVVMSNGKMMGKGVLARQLLALAYGTSRNRVNSSFPLPNQRYDFLVSLPTGQKKALQDAIRDQLGLVGTQQVREEEVYVLTSKPGEFDGLRPSLQEQTGTSMNTADGRLTMNNSTIAGLANTLQNQLDRPVLDESGLSGRFDVYLTWEEDGGAGSNPEALKKALPEQLGLELLHAEREVEMLIVEKVKAAAR